MLRRRRTSPRRGRPGSLLGGALLLAVLMIGAGGAAAQAADSLTVEAHRGPGGVIQITARVVDTGRTPVAGIPVIFQARTTFGWLTLGFAVTDADGTAAATLPAGSPAAEVTVEAWTAPPLSAALRLRDPALAEPAIRPGREVLQDLSPQPGFISPHPVPLQVALLALVLGGVWATYAYVVFLLVKIRRAP